MSKTGNSAKDNLSTTQEELLSSEIRYRRLFEAARDGILILDSATLKIIDVNLYMTEMMGYSRDEFIGREVCEFGIPGDKEKNQAVFQKLRETGFIRYYHLPLQNKDGMIWQVEFICNAYQEGNRQVIQCNIRDMTARDQLERALFQLAEHLEVEKARLIEAQSLAKAGSWEMDLQNNKLTWSDETYRIFEIDPAEFGATYEAFLELLPPDERAVVNKAYTESVANHRPYTIEHRLRMKDNRIKVVLEHCRTFYDEEGKPIRSVGTVQDITDRKLIEDQILFNALHDDLTGLANRKLFMQHLHTAIKYGKRHLDSKFAVLFLDIDRFKVVNDSMGHVEGDKLLEQIARRLESSIRTSDLVARIGGDEFTILLTPIADESDALQIAERIQENLKGGFDLTKREIFTSASIGITFSTAKYTHAEDMLRDADIAMYRAKAAGKAQYQVFNPEMHKEALELIQMEIELQQALVRQEFLLYYQPIIDLKTNNIIAFEALVRWHHPTRGMILPGEFIPIAEETGLIPSFGKWIINESCRQLREWQISKQVPSSLMMSVNLSSKQFQQPFLVEQVSEALKTTGLNANCLKLEITESYILGNVETAVEMMNSLRTLGVKICLDDFGTGYSSLSYLQHLPIDYLKIDHSFINQIAKGEDAAEIVYTIIKLAQNLKVKVIAEGIETTHQLAKLQQLNCEYGQGYFFSKPLEAEAVSFY
jgi:diguanylate cyclase (GGDEF)-like protein/PAS domain S-box-containing protein